WWLSQQQIQFIFSLRSLALHARDLCRRRVEQLFRLPRVQCGRDAALPPKLRQAQAVGRHISRALSDRQLSVERLEREVRVGEVGDEGGDDGAACLFCREILRARRIAQSSEPAPHIQLPGEAKPDLKVGHLWPERAWQRARSSLRHAILRRGRRSYDDRR